MKRTAIACALALGLGVLCVPLGALANVIVTAANGGANLSADKAQNAASPAFTALNNIVITEGATNDFSDTAGATNTLVLTAPSGWRFNAGVGSVSAQNSRNIGAQSISVSA